MYDNQEEDLSILIGKTLESIELNGEEMFFNCTDGSCFHAYHMQDCCEHVCIYDIKGCLSAMMRSPITEAITTVDSEKNPDDVPEDEHDQESFTWTTHTIITKSGNQVVVRWIGTSNGYYGENVHFGRTHRHFQLKDSHAH